MTGLIIILAACTMLVLAIFMAWVLGWANRAFHVEVDPRIEACNAALPGANCGGCGYVGCMEYAEAVVEGTVGVNKCPVGGESVAEKLAEILGVEVEQTWPYRPVVHCGANRAARLGRHEYTGEQQCTAANLVAGVQGCTYGCLGFGDCGDVCDFDAIKVIDGLAQVDYEKCVGCGKCEEICPRHIISMVPFKKEKMLVIQCSNHDFAKEVKQVCKVGCTGCGLCQKMSELFSFKDGSKLPLLDYEKYDPEVSMEEIMKALDKCPQDRLVFVGKPSEKDLEAVEDETVPKVITADFKTTVDETEWRG